MDGQSLTIFFLLFTPVVIGSWQTLDKRSPRELRRDIHYHSKRHMLPRDSTRARRTTTLRAKELRKKPSGYLTPLQEEEIADDDIVSVAVGPPVNRLKYERTFKTKSKINTTSNNKAVNFVKDVLVEIANELLTHQVNEDFIFGQYIGTAMRNISTEIKLKMQQEILGIIQKYRQNQKVFTTALPITLLEEKTKVLLKEEIKNAKLNDTDEIWTDFTNLENIVA